MHSIDVVRDNNYEVMDACSSEEETTISIKQCFEINKKMSKDSSFIEIGIPIYGLVITIIKILKQVIENNTKTINKGNGIFTELSINLDPIKICNDSLIEKKYVINEIAPQKQASQIHNIEICKERIDKSKRENENLIKQVNELEYFKQSYINKIDKLIQKLKDEIKIKEEEIKKESKELENKKKTLIQNPNNRLMFNKLVWNAGIPKLLSYPKSIFINRLFYIEIMIFHKDVNQLDYKFDIEQYSSLTTSLKFNIISIKLIETPLSPTNSKTFKIGIENNKINNNNNNIDDLLITLVLYIKIGNGSKTSLILKPLEFIEEPKQDIVQKEFEENLVLLKKETEKKKNQFLFVQDNNYNYNDDDDDDDDQLLFGSLEFLKIQTESKLKKEKDLKSQRSIEWSYPPDMRSTNRNAINYIKTDSNGNSVGHGAIGANKIGYFIGFLENGGEINNSDNNSEIINPGNPNQRNKLGQTPLHLSTHYHISYEFFKTIIEKKGNPFLKDVFGQTCFHLAVERSYTTLVLHLLRLYPELVFKQNNHGLYPFHFAAMDETGVMIDIFIDFQLELFNKYGRDNAPHFFLYQDSIGMTALHWAASLGLTKVCKKLIQFGGYNQRDFEGETPIFKAIRSSNQTALLYFLSIPYIDKSILNYNGMSIDSLLKFRNLPSSTSKVVVIV